MNWMPLHRSMVPAPFDSHSRVVMFLDVDGTIDTPARRAFFVEHVLPLLQRFDYHVVITSFRRYEWQTHSTHAEACAAAAKFIGVPDLKIHGFLTSGAPRSVQLIATHMTRLQEIQSFLGQSNYQACITFDDDASIQAVQSNLDAVNAVELFDPDSCKRAFERMERRLSLAADVNGFYTPVLLKHVFAPFDVEFCKIHEVQVMQQTGHKLKIPASAKIVWTTLGRTLLYAPDEVPATDWCPLPDKLLTLSNFEQRAQAAANFAMNCIDPTGLLKQTIGLTVDERRPYFNSTVADQIERRAKLALTEPFTCW